MRRSPSQLVLRAALGSPRAAAGTLAQGTTSHWHFRTSREETSSRSVACQWSLTTLGCEVLQKFDGIRQASSLLALPAPGSQAGTRAGTEVRMALEKMSRWEGWLGSSSG